VFHEIAARTIDANGWLRINKPFTISNLQQVIEQAALRDTPQDVRQPR
jgi:hypothetical protein